MTTCPLAQCVASREAVINGGRKQRWLLSASGHWVFCQGGEGVVEISRHIMSAVGTCSG